MTVDMESVADLKELYAAYRHAPDIEAKSRFFSPECMQICQPYPSYAARNRDTIVRFLQESAKAESGIAAIDDAIKRMDANTKHYYTIRPLRDGEFEFGTAEQVQQIGFSDPQELEAKARSEDWSGLRVDLWTDDGASKGLLVKVRYWWRREDGDATQILHHILYLGPRDGTEGIVGEVLQ